MSRVSRSVQWALVAGAAYALFACDSSGPGIGTLAVKMTDAPFPFDSVARVDAWITRVDARVTAADSNETASNTEESGSTAAGWTTVASPNQSYELLSLRNDVTAALGDNELLAGTYNGLRLILDPSKSSVTLKNGTVLDASNGGIWFPSGAQTGIKVVFTNQPISIVADDTTTVLVDFDVSQSFILRGNAISNGLLFKPVVQATVQP